MASARTIRRTISDKALAKIVQETIAFWCEQFVDAGIPAEKLYPHVAAPAPIEMTNAPIWTAFNKYSRPGWTTYAVEVLGESFKPIYDELEKHGNPAWAGVEANAGMPGSVVDWETYLAWHYNHGCVLVGVNMGATGEDLPRRLWDSAFSKEAIAAYRKFLTGQPLVEKPVSMDHPQFRIQAKMKRVRAGIERWHAAARTPRRWASSWKAPSRWRTPESSTSWRNSWTRRSRCWARPRKCPTYTGMVATRSDVVIGTAKRIQTLPHGSLANSLSESPDGFPAQDTSVIAFLHSRETPVTYLLVLFALAMPLPYGSNPPRALGRSTSLPDNDDGEQKRTSEGPGMTAPNVPRDPETAQG